MIFSGVVSPQSSLICTVFCQGDIPSTSIPFCISLLVENKESQQLVCCLKVWSIETRRQLYLLLV